MRMIDFIHQATGTKYPPAVQIYCTKEKLDLLYGYVNGLEDHLRNWPEKVATYAEKQEIIYEDEGSIEITRYIYGMDDKTYDFNSVFREYFPTLQRGATIISLFSFFEHHLKMLCTEFHNKEKLKLKLSDLAYGRDFLKGLKIYLTKVVGIAFPSAHPSWQKIITCKRLRNAIAHNNLIIKKDDSDLLNYIRKSKHLSINEDNEIVIHEGFLDFLLDQFEQFLSILFEETLKFHNTEHPYND